MGQGQGRRHQDQDSRRQSSSGGGRGGQAADAEAVPTDAKKKEKLDEFFSQDADVLHEMRLAERMATRVSTRFMHVAWIFFGYLWCRLSAWIFMMYTEFMDIYDVG